MTTGSFGRRKARVLQNSEEHTRSDWITTESMQMVTNKRYEEKPMHSALNNNLFLVKEHVGLFKAANNFDIYDPQSGEVVLHCREPRLGIAAKVFRFTEYKRFTPFEIEITTPSGEPVCSVHRGFSFFLSTVEVRDKQKEKIGAFKQHLFSLGGAFTVLSAAGKELCHLKGSWTGWNFRFVADDGTEFAHVTKKWFGVGKELFTSADNYVLEIDDSVPADNPLRQIILSAVMCIDMVQKE